FAARFNWKWLIALSLLTWFTFILLRSFLITDSSYSALLTNMGFLSMVVLFTLYYRSWVGFVLLSMVFIGNLLRYQLIQTGVIQPQITELTIRLDVTVSSLLLVYCAVITGYYYRESQ
ncbi:hypothetical protein RZS08_32910, partial [Arthrospira platensis SPKY1]|nr:hypothetical protein [Arthrospira platensis SPKY1]